MSAGRSELRDALQPLCFTAVASSIFRGAKVMITGNPDTVHSQNLFERPKTEAVLLKTVEFAAAARALSSLTV
jgi:biotin synthase-like enzyme